MSTRTIAKFRAEHEIWRKDLAKVLEMPEEELERLETAGKVPPEIAAKIIEAYHLPPDYFTVDFEAEEVKAREAVKALPKSPFRYFFGVSFVWLLLVGIVSALVTVPTSIFAVLDFTVAPFFTYLEMFCAAVITLVSGIYLSSYIRKKTKFYGDIINYEFLYPYLSSMATAWIGSLFNLLWSSFTSVETNLAFGPFLAFLVGIVGFLLSALYTAWLLEAAITDPGKKKDKMLYGLFGTAVAARVLTFVLNLAAYGVSDRSGLFYCNTALSFLLLAAVLVGVLVGAKKRPNLGKLWFVALPVVATLLPELVTLAASAFGA